VLNIKLQFVYFFFVSGIKRGEAGILDIQMILLLNKGRQTKFTRAKIARRKATGFMTLCVGCSIQLASKGHRPETYSSHGFQPVDDWLKDHKSAIGTANVLA
jgi:hypothetical protein